MRIDSIYKAFIDDARELNSVVVHKVDVEHVEALQDTLDHVGDVVDPTSELENVRTLDGSDEVNGNARVNLVIHLVALVLDLVRAFEYVFELVGRFEVLNCLDEDFGFLQSDFDLLLERVEVVELALLGHNASRVGYVGDFQLYSIAVWVFCLQPALNLCYRLPFIKIRT